MSRSYASLGCGPTSYRHFYTLFVDNVEDEQGVGIGTVALQQDEGAPGQSMRQQMRVISNACEKNWIRVAR